MSNKQKQENMFGASSIFKDVEHNFFLSTESPITSSKNDKQAWINDIDSSLILENVDKTAQNRVVKINLKLKTLEKTLGRISEELKVLQLFNLEEDKIKREQMMLLKQNIESQIESLKEEKKKFGIFYIISAYTNNKITYENLSLYLRKIIVLIQKYSSMVFNYLANNIYVKKLLNIVKF